MPRTFPSVIDATSLNGQTGFRISGYVQFEYNGFSVDNAGDINADNVTDLIVGPMQASQAGTSYVVFGQSGIAQNGVFALSSLNGNNGFKINGLNGAGDSLVSGIGDINHDQIDDIAIIADSSSIQGNCYVIFGAVGIANSGFFNLSSVNGKNGFQINCPGNFMSRSISGAGDVNADGISDFVIGSSDGAAIIFGHSFIGNSGFFNISELNGTNGFVFTAGGSTVSKAGDINADGIDDLIIGSRYVLFGTSNIGRNGTITPSELNGTQGFQLTSDVLSVSGAGDLNADGIDDLILGPGYVIFGSPMLGRTGFFDLSQLNGTNGFTFSNVVPGSQSSGIGKYAGDFNGDGISDVVIGPGDIVFGQQRIASSGQFDLLRSLNGIDGLRYDTGSTSLSDAGDVNDDGIGDIIIGNRWESWGGRVNGGSAYVLFGDAVPQLIANELTIVEGQTVILTNSNFNAIRAKRHSPDLLFIVSNVTHGYFSTAGNVVVASFTQQQIENREVQFTHDGSSFYPTYTVSVSSVSSSFSLSSEPYPGNVSFIHVNKPPILINNSLSVNQGQACTLTSSNLFAMDLDNSTSNLLFIVNNIQHGKFIHITDPSRSAITQFFQQNITRANIQFVHDGSEQPPSYDVIVKDGSLSSLPQSSVIYFHRIPVLINNQLVINMGETVVLGPSNLRAVDDNTPDSNLIFYVSDIKHGYFKDSLYPNELITNFSQEDINFAEIVFVADNSGDPPSYIVTVTDGILSTTPSEAMISFNYTRPLPDKPLDTTVRNAIIGAIVSGAVGLIFLGFELWVKHKAHKYFEQATIDKEGGVSKEQANFQKNVLNPIARRIFARIKVAGIMGVSEQTVNETMTAIGQLIRELQQQGVQVDMSQMTPTDQNYFLNTLVRQIRRILIPEVGYFSLTRVKRLFRAEMTPAQLEEHASEIAAAVKKVFEQDSHLSFLRPAVFSSAALLSGDEKISPSSPRSVKKSISKDIELQVLDSSLASVDLPTVTDAKRIVPSPSLLTKAEEKIYLISEDPASKIDSAVAAFQEKLTQLIQQEDGGYTFKLKRSTSHQMHIQFTAVNYVSSTREEVKKELIHLKDLFKQTFSSLGIQGNLKFDWENWTLTIIAKPSALNTVAKLFQQVGREYLPSVTQTQAALFYQPPQQEKSSQEYEQDQPALTCALQ